MSVGTNSTRNNYTGPALRTLENNEMRALLSDNHGDASYIHWEKTWLERRFPGHGHDPLSRRKFGEHSLQQLCASKDSTDADVQNRFDAFVEQWTHCGDKPLLILDVDNTLIYVRYFSDEMEVEDSVTFFATNSVHNQNNAKVKQLKLTLTLLIGSEQLMDELGCECIETSFWIHSNHERDKYARNAKYEYDGNECTILKVVCSGCRIQMTDAAAATTTRTARTVSEFDDDDAEDNLIAVDFTVPNDNLQKLEPCLQRNGYKKVDFIYEGFLVRIRPSIEDFFDELIEVYHIVLYTSAMKCVYEGILHRLHELVVHELGLADDTHPSQRSLWSRVLYRDDCVLKYRTDNERPYYHKDLTLFGRHLSQCVMVDNSPIVLHGQEPNMILIADYFGAEFNERGQSDEELYAVMDVLNDLKDHIAANASASAQPPTFDVRYFLCDLQTPDAAELQQHDLSTENGSLQSSKQFVDALRSDFLQKQATRQKIDIAELSVRSFTRSKSHQSSRSKQRRMQRQQQQHRDRENSVSSTYQSSNQSHLTTPQPFQPVFTVHSLQPNPRRTLAMWQKTARLSPLPIDTTERRSLSASPRSSNVYTYPRPSPSPNTELEIEKAVTTLPECSTPTTTAAAVNTAESVGKQLVSNAAAGDTHETSHTTPASPVVLTPFQRIDAALAQYYKAMAPLQNYSNEHGKGKFLAYVEGHGFDESEVDQELGDHVVATESMYIEMDADFPLFACVDGSSEKHQHRAIFHVIQYCYTHGSPPTEAQYREHAAHHSVKRKSIASSSNSIASLSSVQSSPSPNNEHKSSSQPQPQQQQQQQSAMNVRLMDICKKMMTRHTARVTCIDELSCKLPFSEYTNYNIARLMVNDLVSSNEHFYFEDDELNEYLLDEDGSHSRCYEISSLYEDDEIDTHFARTHTGTSATTNTNTTTTTTVHVNHNKTQSYTYSLPYVVDVIDDEHEQEKLPNIDDQADLTELSPSQKLPSLAELKRMVEACEAPSMQSAADALQDVLPFSHQTCCGIAKDVADKYELKLEIYENIMSKLAKKEKSAETEELQSIWKSMEKSAALRTTRTRSTSAALASQIEWKHVCNVLYQELSPSIAAILKSIIVSEKHRSLRRVWKKTNLSAEVVETIVDILHKERHLSKLQTDYIKQVIEESIQNYPLRDTATTGVSTHKENAELDGSLYPGLTLRSLYDIFHVHSVFMFANEPYTRYSSSQFVRDIGDSSFVRQHKLGRVAFQQSMNLHPTYLINDDLCSVMKYTFAVSHFVHKNPHNTHHTRTAVQLVIIPQSVRSVFDETVEYNCTLDSVDEYLSKQHVRYQMTTLSAAESADEQQLLDVLQNMHWLTNRTQSAAAAAAEDECVIVIDRRRARHALDVLYMFSCRQFILDELRRNYFLGFEFRTLSDDRIAMYTHYEVQKSLRFFGEHLVWFIPRLFHKKLLFEDEQQLIDTLYSAAYKHGVCCNLCNDDAFAKYYQRITKYEHISVNYNRRVLGMMDDDDCDTKDGEMTHRSTADMCSYTHVLDISKCQCVRYLSEQLSSFTASESCDQEDLMQRYDTARLLHAYDHLVRIHGMFQRRDVRQKLRRYFEEKSGLCVDNATPIKCQFVNLVQQQQQQKLDTNVAHMLQNLLCSLHCHLLHDDDTCPVWKAHSERYAINMSLTDASIGTNILQWLSCDAKPMFSNLRHEIVQNRSSSTAESVDADTFWHQLQYECELKSRNIDINHELLNVSELVSLKLYCDSAEHRHSLQRAFIDANSDHGQARTSHYWLARNLYKAYLYAAKPLSYAVRFGYTAQNDGNTEHALFHYRGAMLMSASTSSEASSSSDSDLQMQCIQPSAFDLPAHVTGIELDWISSVHKHEQSVFVMNAFFKFDGGASRREQKTNVSDNELRNQTDDLMFSAQQKGRVNHVQTQRLQLLTPYIKQHYLLFAPVATGNGDQRVLHVLMENDARRLALDNVRKVFASRFEMFGEHHAFHYCSYKINIDANDSDLISEFAHCKYRSKKKKGSEHMLRYDDEFIIRENGTYNIYISNCDVQYHLLQTIKCTRFTSNHFYDAMHTKFKTFHNDTILKLKYVNDIPTQFHADIVNAKYLLKICGADLDDAASAQSNKNVYKFKDINEINMILPFCCERNQCDLYVQPKKHHQFVFIAKIQYHHQNCIADRLNHLFCLLKFYNKSIKQPDAFLQRFNLSMEQLRNELIPSLIRHKDMLYGMSKTSTCHKKDVSVLHRFVHELQLAHLQPILNVFKAKLKKIRSHSLFAYCSYKIKLKTKHKCFANCRYKLESVHRETKSDSVQMSSSSAIHFVYNEEVVIRHNGKYNVYVQNMEAFGEQKYILLQTLTVKESLFEANAKHSFIDNLTLKQSANATTIQLSNSEIFTAEQRDELIGAKFMVSYTAFGDTAAQNDDSTDEFKTAGHEFEAFANFELPIPSHLIDIQNDIYAYTVLVKPKGRNPKEKFLFSALTKITLPQYKIYDKTLSVSNHFRVSKWNVFDANSGVLRLFCQQTLIINCNGIIDANGCGYDHRLRTINQQWQTVESNALAFGHGSSEEFGSFGGGIVELISRDSIINEGRITCDGVLDGSGGTIRIQCKKFINRGIISAKSLGKIIISCDEFVNEAQAVISPKPTIIKSVLISNDQEKSTQSSKKSALSRMWSSKRNKKTIQSSHDADLNFTSVLDISDHIAPKGEVVEIALKYHGHHPHDGCQMHPKVLLELDEKEEHYYLSNKARNDESNYIVFAMEDYEYQINKLCIQNMDNETAIKCIRLYLGSVDRGEWLPLQSDNINSIKQTSYSMQSFEIKSNIESQTIFAHKLSLVKVEILQNHGGLQNAFRRFQLFGQRIY